MTEKLILTCPGLDKSIELDKDNFIECNPETVYYKGVCMTKQEKLQQLESKITKLVKEYNEELTK